MVFSSVVFLAIFLPIVLLLYYAVFYPLKKRSIQNYFLFFVSLLFYAYGEPWFVFVMLLSIIANWGFGLLVDKYRAKKKIVRRVLVFMVILNLAIIFVFKYLMFTLKTVNRVFHSSLPIPEIVLPIGISFFTFQAISYVVDVYRGHGKAQKNPMYVGLYIAFFPQLIAGPIVRYETIADQIENRKENFTKFSEGVCRFIIGLAKKMILSNSMGRLADIAFETEFSVLSGGLAWLGAFAYAFQILFDFSGYSDMAIGLGKMFGFEFLENFEFPYISKSITEFWRRWHISLGTWFRDYVYIPLGGSRVESKSRLVLNLFIVWACTGLWHGANWTFIIWGLLYFVLLCFEKLTGLAKKERFHILRHFYTLFFVLIGWVIFRSESISGAETYIKTMFGGGSIGMWDNQAFFNLCEYASTFLICIIASLPIKNYIKKVPGKFQKCLGYLAPIWYIGLLVLSLAYIAKSFYNPFIYFNF